MGPGGSFADASGVSVGGNTVFIATRSYDENGDVAATHVPGVAGRSISRPLGNCPGGKYTGALADLSLPFIPSCLPTTAWLSGTDIILSQ